MVCKQTADNFFGDIESWNKQFLFFVFKFLELLWQHIAYNDSFKFHRQSELIGETAKTPVRAEEEGFDFKIETKQTPASFARKKNSWKETDFLLSIFVTYSNAPSSILASKSRTKQKEPRAIKLPCICNEGKIRQLQRSPVDPARPKKQKQKKTTDSLRASLRIYRFNGSN